MKAHHELLMGAVIALIVALPAMAGEVKIVANPSVTADSISVAELRSVFLLQRRTLRDGSPVEPVLQKRGATHEAFLRQYLNRDSEEIHIYYQGLVFTGKGSMPKQLDSDTDVIAYVARSRGAIGYVNGASPTDGVRVLVVSTGERSQARALITRVEPEYPETLKRMAIGGTVRLQLIVSPKGTVENAIVLGGNPILGEAAVKAARQWIYTPAAAQTTMEVTIPFVP